MEQINSIILLYISFIKNNHPKSNYSDVKFGIIYILFIKYKYTQNYYNIDDTTYFTTPILATNWYYREENGGQNLIL